MFPKDKRLLNMHKKLLLFLFLITNHLYSSKPTDIEAAFKNTQCNEKLLSFLEKQNQLLEKQLEEQERSNQLQIYIINKKAEEDQQKEDLREQKRAIMEAEENKPWYEKTWDVLAHNIQDAFLRLIIASITGKIVHGAVSALDYATGDYLVQNGYDKYAVYAGTFIAEESIHGYLRTKEKKIESADHRVVEVKKEIEELLDRNNTSREHLRMQEDKRIISNAIDQNSPDVLLWRNKTNALLLNHNTTKPLLFAQDEFNEITKNFVENKYEPSSR